MDRDPVQPTLHPSHQAGVPSVGDDRVAVGAD